MIVEYCQHIDKKNFGNDTQRKTQATSKVMEIPTNLTVGLKVIQCKNRVLRPAMIEAFGHCKLEKRVLIILAPDVALGEVMNSARIAEMRSIALSLGPKYKLFKHVNVFSRFEKYQSRSNRTSRQSTNYNRIQQLLTGI